MPLRRGSANLLQALDVVDFYTLDAAGKPTPVVGATATAKVYTTDRETQIGTEVTLTAEAGTPNDYRGILPANVDLSAYSRVAIRTEVDAGGNNAKVVRWTEEMVVD